jgi:hypothetical protein
VIGHRPDIRGQVIGKIGPRRNRSRKEQFGNRLVVIVDGADDPALEQAEIKACIGGSGLFPLDVGVERSRRIGIIKGIAEFILGGIGA